MTEQHTPEGGASGTGTETMQPTGQAHLDPRKAIFARAAAMTQAERELDIEQVPGAAQMQAGYDQGEQATTDDGDAGSHALQPARVNDGEIDPSAVHAQESVLDSAQAQPTATAPETVQVEMVKLKVFGKDVYRTNAEVEAAGGPEALQTSIAAQEREQQGRFEQAAHLVKMAERLRQEFEEKNRAFDQKSRQAVPTPNGNPTAQPDPAPAAQAGLAAAQKAVEGLWSGDPEVATKALADVLANRPAGVTADPSEIAALVVAKVKADLAADNAKAAQQQQVVAVNELMRSDRFKPIMDDPAARSDAKTLFDAAVRDPRNNGRSMVTIAEEVAMRQLGRLGVTPAPIAQAAEVQAEVTARTNLKRRIPQPSGASERAPSSQQESAFPTRASDIVNQLRAARGQPPQ